MSFVNNAIKNKQRKPTVFPVSISSNAEQFCQYAQFLRGDVVALACVRTHNIIYQQHDIATLRYKIITAIKTRSGDL